MNRRAILLGAALAMSASVAVAQDKQFDLRISHWVPPSHPLHKAMEDWGASIEKASNGTIKYKVYPSQQLGKAFDHYDMARDGIADVTYVSPGYQPGRFPIIDAGNLPFMLTNAKEGTAARRRVVPQIRREGDEGREVVLHVPARSGHVPLQDQEDQWCRPTSRA